MAPAMFISHGSPFFAVRPGQQGPLLRKFAQEHAESISAVLIVSAHWPAKGVMVQQVDQPPTIHDFEGFPEQLYRLRYCCRGAPAQIVAATVDLLKQGGFSPEIERERGLDYGAWIPLMYLFPQANVPAFQVSLPQTLDSATAFEFGRTLAPLRKLGVMVIGSGSLTHNVADAYNPSAEKSYAERFVNWALERIQQRNMEQLCSYRNTKDGLRAHPTEQHFLPLMVAAGAGGMDQIKVLHGGFDMGCMSMVSIAWLSPAEL